MQVVRAIAAVCGEASVVCKWFEEYVTINGFHFRVIGFHFGDWGGCSTLLFMVQAWAPSANFDMSWGPKRGRHNHWHTRLGGGRGQELKGGAQGWACATGRPPRGDEMMKAWAR